MEKIITNKFKNIENTKDNFTIQTLIFAPIVGKRIDEILCV